MLYDFRAEEEGELTVSAGTEVNVAGGSLHTSDGWVLVETATAPFSKGYLPRDYIDVVKTTASPSLGGIISSPASSALSVELLKAAAATADKEQSPTVVSNFAPVRRLSDPRLPQHLLETLDPSEAGAGIAPSSSSSPSSAPAPAPPNFSTTALAQVRRSNGTKATVASAASAEDFAQLFASHDEWFHSAVDRRKAAHQDLVGNIKSLCDRLRAVQDENDGVLEKINELDQLIEGERNQWKQRLDTEKSNITDRVAELYGFSG